MARFYKVAFELIKCHNVPSLRIKRGEISVFEVKVQDGKIHPLSAILFAKKMAKVAVRLRPYGLRRDKQVFTSLCRQAQLHSKGAAFSSLPRRNAMKPGHLHQTPEKPYLLVHRSLVRRWMKSLPLVACEDVSLTLHLLVTA